MKMPSGSGKPCPTAAKPLISLAAVRLAATHSSLSSSTVVVKEQLPSALFTAIKEDACFLIPKTGWKRFWVQTCKVEGTICQIGKFSCPTALKKIRLLFYPGCVKFIKSWIFKNTQLKLLLEMFEKIQHLILYSGYLQILQCGSTYSVIDEAIAPL